VKKKMRNKKKMNNEEKAEEWMEKEELLNISAWSPSRRESL
jgi:hypothetical protein